MQLIHGDCLVEMQKIPDHSVDLILCDLPSGATACSWDVTIPFESLWTHYRRVIRKIGAVVLTANQPFASLLIVSNLAWFKYEWIWHKESKANFMQANYQPLKTHENVLIFSPSPAVFVKGHEPMLYNPQKKNSYLRKQAITMYPNSWRDRTKSDYPVKNTESDQRFPCSVLSINNTIQIGKVHPTEKPITLLEYLIKTYTNEGDLVLDNCMGSGSTGIACLNTNRDFIGIELYPLPDKPISKQNPDYFNIAKNRIAKWKFEPTQDSKEEQINLF